MPPRKQQITVWIGAMEGYASPRQRCWYHVQRGGLFRRTVFCNRPADNLVSYGVMFVWRCDEHVSQSNESGPRTVFKIGKADAPA